MENEIFKKATVLLMRLPWTVLDNRETQGVLSCSHSLPRVQGSSQ